MKSICAIGTLVLLACLSTRAPSALAASRSDFDCSPKVVAIYQPGPNWEQFGARLAGHLDYVKAMLDKKAMAYGAPMSDRAGRPVGGLFVYNEQDLGAVEKLLEEDTFVRDRVAVYSLARWGMCQAKGATK
jgi:uncharacterized protein YciI